MTNDTLQVEIPVNTIDPADASDFEAMRNGVYKETKPGEEKRRRQLTELTDLVLLNGVTDSEGQPLSVHNGVKQFAEQPDAVSKAEGDRYRFVLDADGNVVDIGRIQSIPQDPKRVEAVRRSMARVGWAPKQNETSFKISAAKLPPKKIRL
jgi:hypothetical protein